MTAGLEGERVVVTGSSGRIGSAVTAHLEELGASVIGVSAPAVDTTDAGAVGEVFSDADLVVHLAAIRSPERAPWPKVFANNVTSTFNVLSAAAGQGVRRAMIASSINATGIPMNSHGVLPAYYPFDERLPSDIDDPYSLSKAVDEQTARMVWRHWGMDVVAIRFPLTLERERLVEASERLTADPAAGVPEGWTYLDVRDAARVVELALTMPLDGVQTIFVSADETLVPFRTEKLLQTYAPQVPRLRPIAGCEVPADLTRARSLLGFRASYPLELPKTIR